MCIRDRVNKVVPLEQLEDEYVQWAEEMMLLSPLALRMIKAGLNAELDGDVYKRQAPYMSSVFINDVSYTKLLKVSIPSWVKSFLSMQT